MDRQFGSAADTYEFIDDEASNLQLEWLHQRGDLLRPFAQQSEEIRWDFNILQLFSQGFDAEPHLGPLAVFDGRKIPDPDAFPPEAITFALVRAGATRNRILCARYLDFAFERGRDRDVGARAAEGYVAACEAHLGANQPQDAANALGRAFLITLALGLTHQRDQIKEELLELADRLVERGTDPDVRWGLVPIEALLKWRSWRDGTDLQRVLAIAQRGYEHYSPNSHLARSFLGLRERLLERTGDTAGAKEVRRSAALSRESEGDARTGSALVQMVFYREALEMLRECGTSEDTRRLERKVRGAAASSEDEMHTIEAKVEVDFTEWDEIVDAFIENHGEKAIFGLALDNTFVPDVNAARSLAEEMRDQFPMQSLVTNLVVDDQLRVNVIDSDEEYMEAATLRQYSLDLQFRLVYMQRALARLRLRKLVNADSLLHHLGESPLFAGRNFLWSKAIEYHLQGDYVGALHILVPQIEQAIRVLSEHLGQPVTTMSRGVMQLKTLGGLLSNAVLRDGVGPRFAVLLRFVMSDPQGWNLRNEITHGLANESLFRQPVADLVLLIAIRLGAIRFVPRDDVSPPLGG